MLLTILQNSSKIINMTHRKNHYEPNLGRDPKLRTYAIYFKRVPHLLTFNEKPAFLIFIEL